MCAPKWPGRARLARILAHQLFGVTADIREVADRIAALGYVAVASDFPGARSSDEHLDTPRRQCH
ncbi:dienelactone hydrolase family protein [Streptosporangium sp. NPDC001681]|uniref:dienelactone hydrolase family protein n=1 Tax=Streptosporangium sp. NPDC001681 TaxID=3154395 RepID=UPI0033306C27